MKKKLNTIKVSGGGDYAKVAEMHALRMACPEELSKAYIEEEMGGNNIQEAELVDYAELDNRVEELKEQANQIKDLEDLKKCIKECRECLEIIYKD